MTDNNSRNYAADFIKTISIVAVILIHTTTAFIDRSTPGSNSFYFAFILNQLSRFAVPLFFAVSGFLLATRYQNKNSYFLFYKKRFGKILLPYIFWTIIYFLLIFPNPLLSIFSLNFVSNLLTGDASYQLYFIPAIVILYLLFPFILKHKSFFLSKLFLSLLAIINIAILSFSYYQNIQIPLYSPFKIALFSSFPFMIGAYYALYKEKINLVISKKIFFIALATFVAGALLTTESYRLFTNTQNMDFIRNQWRMSIILYGLGVGILFSRLYTKYLTRWNKSISLLSNLSFGVFFVHVAILSSLFYIIDPYKLYSPLFLVITFIFTTSLSFLFAFTGSKLPIFNKLVG